MRKKPFPVNTGSRFLAIIFFRHHSDRTITYAVWISKFCLIDLKLRDQKKLFSNAFLFTDQIGSEFSKRKVMYSMPGKNLNSCSLNFENRSINFRAMREQNPRTYTQTDIHTDRQTNRRNRNIIQILFDLSFYLYILRTALFKIQHSKSITSYYITSLSPSRKADQEYCLPFKGQSYLK